MSFMSKFSNMKDSMAVLCSRQTITSIVVAGFVMAAVVIIIGHAVQSCMGDRGDKKIFAACLTQIRPASEPSVTACGVLTSSTMTEWIVVPASNSSSQEVEEDDSEEEE